MVAAVGMTVFLPDTNVLVDALNGKRGRRDG